MSSTSSSSTPATIAKHRACDHCRVKKIRCDRNPESTTASCTPCTRDKIRCTFVQKVSVRRSAPKWYVTGLESKVERLQALLTKLHPGVRFPEIESQIEIGSWTTADRPWQSISAVNSPSQPPDAATLEEQAMEQFLLTPYYGATDPYQLIQSAIREHSKQPPIEANDRELFQRIFDQRRSEFWSPLPWEVRLQEAWKDVRFNYPAPELATELIDLYFDHSGALFPLLHRPTFTRNYQAKLHERDVEYGSVLLMVCAIGSRWKTGDSRVLDWREGAPDSNGKAYSAGWPFFEQVQRHPRLYSPSHSLENMQCYALSSIYLLGSSALQVAYSALGFALRLAQQMGLHHRNSFLNNDPSPRKKELWKRVFWVLIVLDRLLSSSLGHSCTLYDEEIDLDLPLAVDDNDWPLDPMAPLPSVSSPLAGAYFSSMICLTGIRVESMRELKIYGHEHGRPHATSGTSLNGLLDDMENQLVSLLDQLPTPLRWDPSGAEQDHITLRQSVFIHSVYYSSFISGHRATLPETRSLLSCVRAGNACINVIAAAIAIGEDLGDYLTGLSVFASAYCIQLGTWSTVPELSDKAGLTTSITTALNILSQLERNWVGGGKYGDILRALASLSQEEGLGAANPSGDLNIQPFPLAEYLPSLEGSVAAEPGWNPSVGPVQNPPPDIELHVGPHNSVEGTDGTAQVDIWSPPTTAAEWEAWQQFLNTRKGSMA